MTDITEEDLRQRRLKTCVANWPYAENGEYNPSCCRFPKSCSPHGYIEAVRAGNLTDDDLEDISKPPFMPPGDDPRGGTPTPSIYNCDPWPHPILWLKKLFRKE